MIKKAVIPAAGKGTRLLPATHAQPKEMLPCGSKPTIQYVVEELQAAGIEEVLIIIGPAKGALTEHLKRIKEKNNIDLNFKDVEQKEPTGLAKAVGLAKKFIGNEPFIVALGDTIIHSESNGDWLKRMVELHEEKKAKATILLEKVDPLNVSKYGIIRGNQTGEGIWEIQDLIEKPDLKDAPSQLAICGRYIFEPDIFSAIDKTERGIDGEYQLTDAIKILIEEDAEVWGLIQQESEVRFDIGDPISYAISFIELSLKDEKIGDPLRKYLTKKYQVMKKTDVL